MKIGILGYGSIGKRHAKNFAEPLGCEVGVHDIVYKDCGKAAWFENRVELIEWADAIVVATPSDSHFMDILNCQAHKKPMLVEKPLTLSVSDMSWGWDYIEMVGYNLRYHACVQKVRQWLPEIGNPIYAHFRCAQHTDKPAYRRDGVIFNYSHEIDLATYLLGVATVKWASQSEDRQIATILLNINDIVCCIDLDALSKQSTRRFVIGGEEGFILCDLNERTVVLYSKATRAVKEYSASDTFDDNYITEALSFLKRLRGEEVIGCTADEAMRVVQICQRASTPL